MEVIYIYAVAIFMGAMVVAGGIAEIIKKVLGKERLSKIYKFFGKEYEEDEEG